MTSTEIQVWRNAVKIHLNDPPPIRWYSPPHPPPSLNELNEWERDCGMLVQTLQQHIPLHHTASAQRTGWTPVKPCSALCSVPSCCCRDEVAAAVVVADGTCCSSAERWANFCCLIWCQLLNMLSSGGFDFRCYQHITCLLFLSQDRYCETIKGLNCQWIDGHGYFLSVLFIWAMTDSDFNGCSVILTNLDFVVVVLCSTPEHFLWCSSSFPRRNVSWVL